MLIPRLLLNMRASAIFSLILTPVGLLLSIAHRSYAADELQPLALSGLEVHGSLLGSFPKQSERLYLRMLAERQHLSIGAAVSSRALKEDAVYGEYLTQEFNLLTAENAMKFRRLHPNPDRFDFERTDQLVSFALSNQMQVRGHTLVWHYSLPDWLKEGDWSRDEAITILENYIKTVVGRYRGQILAWDVVNEAVADDGTFRKSFWFEVIGPEYIEMAFRWAREADPDALLFYNDYGGEGLNNKSDAIYQLVKSLVEASVPIDGVGFQMHVAVGDSPPPQDVASNMNRLAELGLQAHITEMDVRIRQPAIPEDFARQAEIYQSMLEVCLTAENCDTFITWGFSDRYSWIPSHFQGWGDALLFDMAFQPKPAYDALRNILMNF